MRIAYLINQYPHISHSFIRREIAALESLGVQVQRYSLRGRERVVADPLDVAEQQRTRVVLESGLATMLGAVALTLAANPRGLARAVCGAMRLGWCSDRGLLRHLAYLVEACVLWRWMRQDQIKHLHAHFGTNSAAVAMLVHLLGGIRYSFTVHGPEEFDRPQTLSLGRKIRAASFVVAISHFTRSQLCRWCGCEDWPKIRVVHCGVDGQYLETEDWPDVPADSRRLVCVGRLCEQKGQLLLIEAVSRLVREGIRVELTLIGDGPMRGQIERAIRDGGLEHCVQLAGWCSGAEVRAHLLNSRALVLPSFAEGLPLVLMEAMALGRAVISTYVGGIPELVEPGSNGWLVPAGSVEALVQAMRQALEIPAAELRRMGRAGRDKVLKQHDARKEAAKLAELFDQSLHEQRAAVAEAGCGVWHGKTAGALAGRLGWS
ncbi:glycosyltransferase [Fontivita pretiosa]|uniref:glycosyltransferase n=1 Tax=Fontivita pretiosa TaxID=2989684 RepID=UPI003D16ADA7